MNDPQALISISLLISIVLISLMGFRNYDIIEQFKHFPYEEFRSRSFYRWFTCTFLHGDFFHLFLNAFVLWQFGFVVESICQVKFGFYEGMIIYFSIYILLAILSSVPTYLKYKNNPTYSSIGASGVISGLLFIYILYFPMNILLIYGIIPMPAFLMGILYLSYSWWASRKRQDGIDHEAHFWGAAFGLIIGFILKLT
jgi:membrane associated rhomboid family serine protease